MNIYTIIVNEVFDYDAIFSIRVKGHFFNEQEAQNALKEFFEDEKEKYKDYASTMGKNAFEIYEKGHFSRNHIIGEIHIGKIDFNGFANKKELFKEMTINYIEANSDFDITEINPNDLEKICDEVSSDVEDDEAVGEAINDSISYSLYRNDTARKYIKDGEPSDEFDDGWND